MARILLFIAACVAILPGSVTARFPPRFKRFLGRHRMRTHSCDTRYGNETIERVLNRTLSDDCRNTYCATKVSRCCRTRQAFVFAYVLALFDAFNLTYVIGDGSLIGALRHSGMNPCDADEEIFVFMRQYYDNATTAAPGDDRRRFNDAIALARKEREVKIMRFGNIMARRDSAEHFSRLNAVLCTAMAWIFIPACCFAIP